MSVGRRPRTEGLVADGVGVANRRAGLRGDRRVPAHRRRRRVGRRRHRGRHPAAGPRRVRRGHRRGQEACSGEPVVPVDNAKVPWAIYCHPEVAFCGMTEAQAKEAGIPVVTKKDPFGGNSRAQIIGDTEGLVKIIAEQRRRRDGGTDPRRAPVRALGDRAAGRRLSGRQLGGASPKRWHSSFSRTRRCPRPSARRCWR